MAESSEDAADMALRDSDPFEAVLRELLEGGDATDGELLTGFAKAVLRKSPPRLLSERSPAHVAALIQSAFDFLRRSRADRVDVEIESPADRPSVTIVRADVSERPFVVDTLRELFHAEGLSIELYIYPVLHVERDEDGDVISVAPADVGPPREALVHCEVTRIEDPERLEALRERMADHLHHVVAATDDFSAMVNAVDETVAILAETARDIPTWEEEVSEVQAFLRWLRDGGFVFLGYRGYRMFEEDGQRMLAVEPGSGLGILRNDETSSFAEPVPVERLPDRVREMLEEGPLLAISKTNAMAPVHRRARMDDIGVTRLDAQGRIVGERRFVGLFTSQAYSEKSENIPILRRKLELILARAGVQEGTHDYKEIHTIFNSLPKEELFLTSAEEIGADIRTVLTTYDPKEIRVTFRTDPLGRGVSVMVILPKDRFSGEVRRRIEEAFREHLGGDVLNYHLTLGEGDQARLHFQFAGPPQDSDFPSTAELEEIVRKLTRTWTDRIRDGLEQLRPDDEARRLASAYGGGFSPEYQAATGPESAIADIVELESMGAEGRSVGITFANPDASPAIAGGDPITELKLYLLDGRFVLSDFMPILENCGLRVIGVTPFEVRGPGVVEAALHTFFVQDADARPLDIQRVGSRLAEMILAVRAGDATDDTMNSLVVGTDLAWREVEVLRAYSSFAFQGGTVPSRLSLPSALSSHPRIASLLFEFFRARFDPDGVGPEGDRSVGADRIRTELREAMNSVNLLSDDRALRALRNLIEATVRTNYFRGGGRRAHRKSGGVPYLSLKLDCSRLEGAARTRLRYEVWVRSSRMEGVHLRGSRVARGGIRYSDRPDDFRTEVLGLVHTQMVKNAVIVPAGAKGGFVTLRPLAPDRMDEEARDQYRTLVRGLLDITDNLRDGAAVPPESVVCYDEPDPYLVVAADKGTAAYSDTANEVAAEYGFWMGDAFASGGSNGYDHKELGITARGAWECVKRHFLELGKDIQEEPFTVVGVGDMSGDVFGNGMLLSRQIRLIAAFDHRDIFIDPDPDPEASYDERERLFGLDRSSWQDYEPEVLSRGGLTVPRSAKEVRLEPETKQALGLPADAADVVDGEELVRMVLRAPAELLWNGGIGTYVKASHESHADVGDPTNNAVRVNADELRCRVVGEGGNLGLTQPARIEYALQGGRINTDAIDNSGGVDLSDREVNLKLLLDERIRTGNLEGDRRNELLRELAEAVSELVLEDNRSQSRAVSLDELRAKDAVDDLRDVISGFERDGLLDRSGEHLPTWEVIAERQGAGLGFSRPELAVLLAYGKLHLKAHLRKSGLIEDPEVRRYLRDYFPGGAWQDSGGDSMDRHPLRGEIIASQFTNELVDSMGAGFIHRVRRDTGRSPEEISRAWLIASLLTGKRELMRHLREKGPSLSRELAYEWLLGLDTVLDRTTRWFLANERSEHTITQSVERNLKGLASLRASFPDIVTGEDLSVYEGLIRELTNEGVAEDFARQLVTLRFLEQLLEILRAHRRSGVAALDVARTFYGVADLFRISRLRQMIASVPGDDRWEQRSARALMDDLSRAHQQLVAVVLREHKKLGDPVAETLQNLSDHHRDAMGRFRGVMDEIEETNASTLPGLTVAVRELLRTAKRFGGEPA